MFLTHSTHSCMENEFPLSPALCLRNSKKCVFEAVRMFELYNYNNNGRISVDEFVTIKLNQKLVHVGKLSEDSGRLMFVFDAKTSPAQ